MKWDDYTFSKRGSMVELDAGVADVAENGTTADGAQVWAWSVEYTVTGHGTLSADGDALSMDSAKQRALRAYEALAAAARKLEEA